MIKRFIDWIKKEDFWDLMAWASLAMIFFWAVAKSFGWINTPPLVEMLPFFGAVYWGGRLFQKNENLEWRLHMVEKETAGIEKGMDKMQQKFHEHDLRFIRIENRLQER